MSATEEAPLPAAVPVLVVTGFLGAGKTTFINRLLSSGHRRIAAIVNDFGAINLDVALIEGQADTVVGLENGCICCSLQGDLLRALKQVLAHEPEAIVIEASGVSDPRGIAQALVDPVLWAHVRLDCTICIVDVPDLAETPARMQDPIWRAQARGSDFALLAKAEDEDLSALMLKLGAEFRLRSVDAREPLPLDLLFPGIGPGTGSGGNVRLFPPLEDEPVQDAGRFVALEWSSPGALPFNGFQRLMEDLAPGLYRAKGFISLRERPGAPLLFQMVGRRATFEPAAGQDRGCRLVLIGDRASFDPEPARARLEELAEREDSHD